MATVKDGYITGESLRGLRRCPICNEQTLCFSVEDLQLPQGVTVRATILLDKTKSTPNSVANLGDLGVRHVSIGAGCGCYAKFHRQLVHITG